MEEDRGPKRYAGLGGGFYEFVMVVSMLAVVAGLVYFFGIQAAAGRVMAIWILSAGVSGVIVSEIILAIMRVEEQSKETNRILRRVEIELAQREQGDRSA